MPRCPRWLGSSGLALVENEAGHLGTAPCRDQALRPQLLVEGFQAEHRGEAVRGTVHRHMHTQGGKLPGGQGGLRLNRFPGGNFGVFCSKEAPEASQNPMVLGFSVPQLGLRCGLDCRNHPQISSTTMALRLVSLRARWCIYFEITITIRTPKPKSLYCLMRRAHPLCVYVCVLCVVCVCV